MNEELKDHAEQQREVRALKEKVAALLAAGKPPQRKPASVLTVILIMAAVWGFYWLDSYEKLHPSQWYLAILSLFFATGGSAYLLYCWRKQRLYNGVALRHGQWIYRDEDPLIYWAYMALFSFLNGALIYEGITHWPQ